MKMDYYGLKIIYGKELYYVWCTCEDGDKFLTKDNKLLSFNNIQALNEYCRENQIYLAEKECTVQRIPSYFDLLNMCKKKNTVFFCKVFLDLWNLSLDINHSFEYRNPYLDGCHHLYDKIFRGNNLNAFTLGKELYAQKNYDMRQIKNKAERIISGEISSLKNHRND